MRKWTGAGWCAVFTAEVEAANAGGGACTETGKADPAGVGGGWASGAWEART